MQLIRRALNALQIIAKRSHDCLIHGAGFLCHIRFRGSFDKNLPVHPFCELLSRESTPHPSRCAQLLLNSPSSVRARHPERSEGSAFLPASVSFIFLVGARYIVPCLYLPLFLPCPVIPSAARDLLFFSFLPRFPFFPCRGRLPRRAAPRYLHTRRAPGQCFSNFLIALYRSNAQTFVPHQIKKMRRAPQARCKAVKNPPPLYAHNVRK